MSAGPVFSIQEAIAREVIRERTRLRPRIVRRHARTGLILRRLAERLDPEPEAIEAPTPPAAGRRPGGIPAARAC